MDSTPREKKGRKLFPTPRWSCFKQPEHTEGRRMTRQSRRYFDQLPRLSTLELSPPKQTFDQKKLFSSFLSPDTHLGLEENPPSTSGTKAAEKENLPSIKSENVSSARKYGISSQSKSLWSHSDMASLVSDSQDGEDVGDVEDVDQTLTARNELDLTFTVPENNHSLSDDPSDITFIQTTSRESDLMTSDGPPLEAIECVSFPNLLSIDTIVQSTEEMCKTFMVPGLSGELLENTTSTSSSSLAHRLENFKDYFKQNENNLTSINTTKFDFNEPLDFSSKSNKAIDYLIKPSIKKKPMDTVLSEHSQNGRYNLADESVPWPNTSGISKMQDSLVSSSCCSKTFTQCYGDPKEQLPQDTSKGAIKKVNTKPKIDSHKDELFTSKLDNKPVRDLTTLSKIPIPKSSALAKGKVSRIPLRTNVQLDKLRPRNPLQSSNANVNQKSQPLLLTKPKIQFGSSGAPNLMIFKAKPTQEPFKRGVNVGFELGQNIAEGSYGNNTKRQATAAKRRLDAKSLAGKMPNRTKAGVLERQQSYANVVRTNKAHELIMQRRQLTSKISSPWY